MELSKKRRSTEIFRLNGEEFEFNVREPGTDERLKYLASIARKINGKILSGLEEKFKAKYEFGCELITGFPENNSDGKPQFQFEEKPVSSDKSSPNYREDWRELILPLFMNPIMIYSTKIFDGIDVNDIKLKLEAKGIPESEELSDESPLGITS
mgnify:CR=1